MKRYRRGNFILLSSSHLTILVRATKINLSIASKKGSVHCSTGNLTDRSTNTGIQTNPNRKARGFVLSSSQSSIFTQAPSKNTIPRLCTHMRKSTTHQLNSVQINLHWMLTGALHNSCYTKPSIRIISKSEQLPTFRDESHMLISSTHLCDWVR